MASPSPGIPSASQLTPEYLAQSRVGTYLSACIAPLVVASIFVVARIYTRSILTKNWGYDDTAMTLAWWSSITLSTVSCISTLYGAGRHIEALQLSAFVPGTKLIYVSRLLYLIVIFACKIAFCASYLRIFLDRSSRFWIWCILAFTVATTIPVIFLSAFPCIPVSKAWDFRYTASCFAGTKNFILIYLTGSVNVLGDVMLLAFIIPRIIPLKMAKIQKITLTSLVSLSFLIVIAALIRMVKVAASNSSPDATWALVDVVLWSSIEANTALICVATPAIKPLIKSVLPALLGTSLDQSRTDYHTTPLSRKRTGLGSMALEERGYRLENVAETDVVNVKNGRDVVKIKWQDHNSKVPSDSESELRILANQKSFNS